MAPQNVVEKVGSAAPPSARTCPLCGSSAALFVLGTTTPAEALLRGYRIAEGQTGGDRPTVFRCGACGVGFVPHLPDPAVLLDLYRGAAPDQRYLREFPGRRRTARRILKTLAGFVRPPGTLLDVGCAAGAFLAEARAAGWTIQGREPSEWGRRAAASILGPEVVTDGDVLGLAAADRGRYRVVTAFDLLEHVTDPRRAVGALVECLERSGVLVLTTPRFESITARLLGARWPMFLPVHLWYFTRASLERLLRAAGLRPLLFRPHRRYFSIAYLGVRACEALTGATVRGVEHRVSPVVRRLTVPCSLGDEWEVYARK